MPTPAVPYTRKKRNLATLFVWVGNGRRVRLTLFDFRHAQYTGEHKVTFSVEAISAASDPNTSFASGETPYHGPDPRAAIREIRTLIGATPEIPDELMEFL
jgi:hypothetical protein